ncbi:MAG: NAD(P)-dependent oxidoreductase [Bryobacteraceae bacterium]|nr:NAD(P)-dependent oxidoreductase [Bryobacteraceae bacterium]
MIFILGGRGFVGSAFVRFCQTRGLEHSVVDRDNYAAHTGRACSLFVNANGNSSKLLSKSDPMRDFEASVRTVRASLTDFRFDRYLHLSSCDVYPDCSSPETTREDQPLDPARQSAYGFHKFLAEQCVIHSGSNWTIFRLGGMTGPGLRKNAVFDILQGGPLWLDPESALQFMPTDDVARIAMEVAADSSRQIFNLCGSGLATLKNLMAVVPWPVTVRPDSPRVRYEVSVAKIGAVATLPDSGASTASFLAAQIERKRRVHEPS